MATVRFSKELIESIEKNARAKMQPAVDRAKEQKLDNKWGQTIYDTLFLEDLPILNQVPKNWVKTVDSIKIERVGSQRCSLDFKFVTPMPWPQQFIETELAKKESSWGDSLVLKDHMTWGELFAEVKAYNERVQVAATRQTEFVTMVKKVIEQFSTLSPALKAWPPLWDLIPEDVKVKHRQVVEREKKEVKLEVDLGKLTALSTAAKFGV